jgi:hypothetical protein
MAYVAERGVSQLSPEGETEPGESGCVARGNAACRELLFGQLRRPASPSTLNCNSTAVDPGFRAGTGVPSGSRLRSVMMRSRSGHPGAPSQGREDLITGQDSSYLGVVTQ